MPFLRAFVDHISQRNCSPVRWEHSDLCCLQFYPVGLFRGDRPIGEQMAHQRTLELARGGKHALGRFPRPLHRLQHIGNRTLLGEWGKRNTSFLKSFLKDSYGDELSSMSIAYRFRPVVEFSVASPETDNQPPVSTPIHYKLDSRLQLCSDEESL
jgi:hypothetical protein